MIPTLKPPQRPDYPEPGCRGYMRERAYMAQVLAASMLPDRPRVVRRKRRSHSTHWMVPARRARMMLLPGVRRHQLAVYWNLALACQGVTIIDNGPGFRPTVLVPI